MLAYFWEKVAAVFFVMDHYTSRIDVGYFTLLHFHHLLSGYYLPCTVFDHLFLVEMHYKEDDKYINIASGSEANMTTLCEMEFFDFLWLIWVHYLPLPPT